MISLCDHPWRIIIKLFSNCENQKDITIVFYLNNGTVWMAGLKTSNDLIFHILFLIWGFRFCGPYWKSKMAVMWKDWKWTVLEFYFNVLFAITITEKYSKSLWICCRFEFRILKFWVTGDWWWPPDHPSGIKNKLCQPAYSWINVDWGFSKISRRKKCSKILVFSEKVGLKPKTRNIVLVCWRKKSDFARIISRK